MIKKSLLLVLAAFFCMKAFSEDLPSGYKNIRLGMSMDDVKSELKKDLNFGYRGERDISLLSGENESIIETDTSKIAPYSFLERCWFQFQDEALFTITINITSMSIHRIKII